MYYVGSMTRRGIYLLGINMRMENIVKGYSMILMTPQREVNGRKKKNQEKEILKRLAVHYKMSDIKINRKLRGRITLED
jgi:hypothetical protein